MLRYKDHYQYDQMLLSATVLISNTEFYNTWNYLENQNENKLVYIYNRWIYVTRTLNFNYGYPYQTLGTRIWTSDLTLLWDHIYSFKITHIHIEHMELIIIVRIPFHKLRHNFLEYIVSWKKFFSVSATDGDQRKSFWIHEVRSYWM